MNTQTGELTPDEMLEEPVQEPPHDDTAEPENYQDEPADRNPWNEDSASGEEAALVPSVEEMVLHHNQILQGLGEAVRTGQEQTDAAMKNLGATMAHIADEVKALKEAPPADKPDPWNWKHLSGEPAAELLDTVREWVDWYNGHYGVIEDIRIPGCWYLHPPVVEELTALWVAWQAAFYGHRKPDTAATYWHSAYLWPTIKRLRVEAWGMKKCLNVHVLHRPVTSTSTDNGYALARAELSKSTQPPVIPWPGQTQPPATSDSAPL